LPILGRPAVGGRERRAAVGRHLVERPADGARSWQSIRWAPHAASCPPWAGVRRRRRPRPRPARRRCTVQPSRGALDQVWLGHYA